MRKVLFILFCALPIVAVAQNKVEFAGERIDFTIDREWFSVNGIYYFTNGSDAEIRQNILFPCSLQADSIEIIRVYNLSTLKSIDYQLRNHAIAFKIIVLAGDTSKVNIAYRQKTSRVNEYVLESTQTWGKALIHASYSLTFCDEVRIDSLSIQPDTIEENVYYWQRTDFYPDFNFTVWIQ